MSSSRPARLLFDANIGRPMIQEVARLLEVGESDDQAEIMHVFDFQTQLGLASQGVWDEVWIPEAARSGWTIVAADRGKGGISKGKKLPDLCIEFNLTHVLISAAVHQRRRFKKLSTLLSVWHELVDAASGPPGVRYLMESASALQCHRGKGRLGTRSIIKAPKLKRFIPPSEAGSADNVAG